MLVRAIAVCVVAIAFTISARQPVSALVRHRLLAIAPIAQRTPESCWLAVAEMILRYFRVPVDNVDVPAIHDMDAQCTIFVITFAPPDHNCTPSTENVVEVRSVMSQYAIALRSTGKPGYANLNLIKTDNPNGSALDFGGVKNEIDAARPVAIVLVVAGVEHVVLIVGYDDLVGGGQYVTINDPYPYAPTNNPWATFASSSGQPMQYTMTLSQLNAAAQWTDSLTGFATVTLPKAFEPLNPSHPDVKNDSALEVRYASEAPTAPQWLGDVQQLIEALQASPQALQRFGAASHFGTSCGWLPTRKVVRCIMLASDGSDSAVRQLLDVFAASLPAGYSLVRGANPTDYWVSGYNIEFHSEGRIVYIDAGPV